MTHTRHMPACYINHAYIEIITLCADKSFEALHAAEIDAVKEHRELARAQLDRCCARLGARKSERALFEPLVPERESVAVPVQHLEPVAAPLEVGERKRKR